MLMNRENAKKKWCPFYPSGEEKCIADRCAAWRWAPIMHPEDGARRFHVASNPCAEKEENAGPKPEHCRDWQFCPYWGGEPAGWLEPEENALERRLGYCGLAGKPQM